MSFSMWRIESDLDDAGAPYDRRAATYDRLVRSKVYNRFAWGTSPRDYTAFAATAFASDDGPLLEVAAGSAAATAELHARSGRPTVLVDLSRAMLDRAGQRIAAATEDGTFPPHVRLKQADLLSLQFPANNFTTVVGLGLIHLIDNIPALVKALQHQLAPEGRLYLSGLVAETRRGRLYLDVLHKAGEVTTPLTADELREALGQPDTFSTIGCVAFATLAPL
jgi:ubiquinone/menaquinone biosynthesis C-methylase UbiE